MTAPTAVVYSLGPGDRRRLVVDNEDGTYQELVGTVTAVHPTTINIHCDEDGAVHCLYRRQILHAGPAERWVDPYDPTQHCKRGRSYRLIHHGADGQIAETVGEVRVAATDALLLEVGDINLKTIARSSILFAPEATQ